MVVVTPMELILQKFPSRAGVDTSSSDKWLRYPNEPCSQNVIDMNLLDIPVCVHDDLKNGECLFVLLIPTKEESGVLRCSWMNSKMGLLEEKSQCIEYPLVKTAIREASLYNMITVPLMGVFTTKMQKFEVMLFCRHHCRQLFTHEKLV